MKRKRTIFVDSPGTMVLALMWNLAISRATVFVNPNEKTDTLITRHKTPLFNCQAETNAHTRNARLGCDVVGLTQIADFGRNRRDVDDGAASSISVLDQLLAGDLSNEKSAFEIDVDDLVELLVGHRQQESVFRYSCHGKYGDFCIFLCIELSMEHP